jgi:hypothetical protein
MRTFLLLISVFFYASFLNAQNVGIGTTTPSYPLTVVTNGIGVSQESTGGLVKIGFYTTPTVAYLQTHTNTDLYFATNNGAPQMTLSTGGNIGIGTSTPKFPLTFPDADGDKISLWGGNTSVSNPHYGFGIQGGLMQIYTNSPAGDISFGYGSSSSFTQNILMKGDGNMNIGGPIWASAANDRVIRFGDGDFVHIGEVGQDDRMELKSGSGGFFFTGGRIGINIAPDPTARLYINGPLRITDGTQGAGKVLMSDASGAGTWQYLPSVNSAFRANAGSSVIIPSGGSSVFIPFNTEKYDQANSLVGDTYIIPATGVYHFDVMGLWSVTTVGISYSLGVELFLNGSSTIESNFLFVAPGTAGTIFTNLSIDDYLVAGDIVQVRAKQFSGINQSFSGLSVFTGHRVN